MSGITCTMRPSGAAIRDLERAGNVDPRSRKNLFAMLDELAAVDVLANLLDEALVATTKGSGQLDLKAVAAYVLRTLKEHQK